MTYSLQTFPSLLLPLARSFVSHQVSRVYSRPLKGPALKEFENKFAVLAHCRIRTVVSYPFPSARDLSPLKVQLPLSKHIS